MPVLKTVVEPATKTRFRGKAQVRGMSESELLRAVVLSVTGEDRVADSAPEPEADTLAPARMTVRLSGFLLQATQQRARAKGMAPSRYVAALVQSHLSRQPVMATQEIQALLRSGRELAALGRNLNQIAHALNSAFHETERVKLDQLEALQLAVLQNRAAIRALVRASQNAWSAE